MELEEPKAARTAGHKSNMTTEHATTTISQDEILELEAREAALRYLTVFATEKGMEVERLKDIIAEVDAEYEISPRWKASSSAAP
jgi:hypothetical protein